MSEPPPRGLSFSTWPPGTLERLTPIVEAFLEGSGRLTQDDMARLRNIVRRTELPDAPDADVETLLREVLNPLVRKLAADKNVDLSTLAGTGSSGRIRREDVLEAAQTEAASGPVTAPAAPAATSGQAVKMPALGTSTTEGTVTRWLKAVGDAVEEDEPLLEVSTDKVDTEIPSPLAGVLERILVREDETVKVGTELAVIAAVRNPNTRPVSGDVSAAQGGTRLPAVRASEPSQESSWSKWRALGRRVEVTHIAGSRGGQHTHTLFGLTPGSGSPVAWSAKTDSVTAQWRSAPFPTPSEESGTNTRRAKAGSVEQQRFVGLTSFSGGPGHQEVFLASAEGDLFASHRLDGTPWSRWRWQRISWVGGRIRQISGLSASRGHATIFTLTTDSRLLHTSFKVGEDPPTWNEMGMPAPGRYVSLAAFSRSPGHQELVVAAADGSLFTRHSHHQEWSPWQKIGDIPHARQVIGVGVAPDEQRIFVLTSDSRLLGTRQRSTADTDGWEEIELPSRDLCVGIAAYSLTPGRIFFFAASESGSVHFRKLTTDQEHTEEEAHVEERRASPTKRTRT